MPVGFQSFVSGTSIVQIDADGPPVLQLVAYGVIPMISAGTGYRTAFVGLPPNLNPSNILVFIKPGVGGQAKLSNIFIGSTGIFFESDTSQTTLEYYIFGPPVSSGFGLELRNNNNTLVFSSNSKPCILENLWTNVSYSSPPTMLVDSSTAICTKNDVSYCYATGLGPPGPGGLGNIGFTNYYRRKLPYYSGSNVLWKIITAMDTFADSFTQASIGDVSTSTVISTKVGDVNIGATDYTIDSVNWPDISGASGTPFITPTQVISGTEVPVILGVSYTIDGFPSIQFNINGTNIFGSNVLVFPGQSVGFQAFRGTTGSNTVTVTNVNTGVTIDTFVITFTAAGSTYSASASSPVNEGSSSTVTVTTTNVANGTTLYWTVLNGTTANADFSATSGSFTVNSNSGSFSVSIVADATTEGSQTFSVEVRTGSTSGSIVAISNTVTINDTSTTPTPTYALTPNDINVNEGSIWTCIVDTTNVPNGTVLYWTILDGTAVQVDFSPTSGNVTINSNEGQFEILAVADNTTEGYQSATVQLRTDSTSGPVVATTTIGVNDTSTTPPTYAITPSISSVNEGSSVTFTITTTNFGSGTLYWTTSGSVNSSDFTTAISGPVSITSNSGTIVRTLSNDSTTEGSETFALQLRTDSTNGPIVATSSTVTVNDTSTTPSTTITLSNKSFNAVSSLGASITVQFTVAGDIFMSRTGILTPGPFDEGDWISPKTGAGSDYEIFVSQTNNGGTVTGTLNTWLPFDNNRTWSYNNDGVAGAYTATLTITIRGISNPSITGSAVYTLNIENND